MSTSYRPANSYCRPSTKKKSPSGTMGSVKSPFLAPPKMLKSAVILVSQVFSTWWFLRAVLWINSCLKGFEQAFWEALEDAASTPGLRHGPHVLVGMGNFSGQSRRLAAVAGAQARRRLAGNGDRGEISARRSQGALALPCRRGLLGAG